MGRENFLIITSRQRPCGVRPTDYYRTRVSNRMRSRIVPNIPGRGDRGGSARRAGSLRRSHRGAFPPVIPSKTQPATLMPVQVSVVHGKEGNTDQAYEMIVQAFSRDSEQATDCRAWGLASEHRRVASERERSRGRSCRLRRSAGTAGRHSLLYARGRNKGKKCVSR